MQSFPRFMEIALKKNAIKVSVIMKTIHFQTQEQKNLLTTTTDLKELIYFTSTNIILLNMGKKAEDTYTADSKRHN